MSEVITILIYFHQSQYRNFKAYYTEYVCKQLCSEFPNLVSYERFVILMPSALGPLSAYLKSLYGRCRGISFIDSTALEVCDPHRIHNHKVFEGFAERGKGSMGWFYSLKLHLVVNDCGEILAVSLLQAMWMTGSQFQFCPNAYSANSLPIGDIFLSLCLNNYWKPSTFNSSRD
jgi:Transposase DDE domain